MNTSWGLKVGVLCALSAVGCKAQAVFPSYVGMATEQGHVQEDISPMTPEGRVNVRNWDTQRPRPNVRVTMTADGEHRYRLVVPPCTVLFEMEAPGYTHGHVVVQPRQSCEIDIDHYRGPLPVVGNVQVIAQDRTIQLLLSGTNNQVSPHIRWTLNYDGRAE